MRTMKHWVLAVAAASALALAGCGGGGSSGGMQGMMEESTPTPAELATTASDLLDTAETDVNAVMDDSDGATVTTAEMAVAAAEKAVMAASESDDHATLTLRLGKLQGSLATKKSSRQTAMTAAAEAGDKATTATAKALKKAITDVLALTTQPPVTISTIPEIDLDGPGDGTDMSTPIPLKKGDSAGSLGNWDGTDYAGMVGTGTAKTTGMYRRYSNQEEAKSVSFASEAGEMVHGLPRYVPTEGDSAGDYALTGTGTTVTTTGDPGVSTEIGGFPTTGTHDYEEDDTVTGTYMGGAGTYKCIADTCASNAEGASGINLSEGWTFTPSGGSMVQDKDGEYLHFGWWIRKDSKDDPTHAGVLYDTTGATLVTESTINDADSALVGPATYVGAAAGKFAVSDPLRPGEDNAGHFTADAELMADFKAGESTLKGTIDEFRLNDGSTNPGWIVELQKAMFIDDDDAFKTAETPAGDQTVWSIGGNKGAAAGSWEAQMYDDKTADDTNVPQSVVGSFSAEISTTHSMVGAFGAERTERTE